MGVASGSPVGLLLARPLTLVSSVVSAAVSAAVSSAVASLVSSWVSPSWVSPAGCPQLGVPSWVFPAGCPQLGHYFITWVTLLPQGVYYPGRGLHGFLREPFVRIISFFFTALSPVPWARSHGPGPMSPVPWARTHGSGPMGSVPWARSHDRGPMGPVLKLHYFSLNHVECPFNFLKFP